ncbi:metallophosphoesterase [Saccharomonospora viridis]|jgi:predicted MPP superfamily phosphohydrolase|uniref:Predicted phosphohydrolase n=1 Tax=Saccharomonospora viridis (strain ATCC 15386 / DSM 43017 / JCM 3036 / CCUG 5913 / NBRC 12207 / NCIMB 9602 / P101) TaxID=471857 RepID=C7MR79_SACVD|nr:metallophosphoesterase [Saccharomonospora viridis]ACU98665.1 predicted phosphohydrolase [Saccharomonospora viridis DSM 43017]
MFFAVLSLLIAVVHLYLWKRLVADTTPPRSRSRRVGTAVLVTFLMLMMAALSLGTSVPPDIARWFAWPGYLWLAVFFYLLLTLLVLELPRLVLRRWLRGGRDEPGESGTSRRRRGAGKRAGHGACVGETSDEPSGGTRLDSPAAANIGSGTEISRRTALARGSALVASAVAVGLTGYGVSVAMGPPTVTRVPITLRRLDPRVEGCRIALISDVHLGPIIGRSFTQRIVDLVNVERVDAVAIAGDLVDGDVADLADAAAPLAKLRSTHGTYYVTGNHEYYSGYRQWIEYLPTLGVRPLRNERVEIHHNGGVFDLAGINDATGYQWQDPGDVEQALAGRDPARAVVLLAHQPVDFTQAVDHDVDLLLAGHTHGGQLTPFEVAVQVQQGAVAGLYQRGNTKMYVTRGAGFWGPPVRVGAPPDITVVELRRG